MKINLSNENLSQPEIRDYLKSMYDEYLRQIFLNDLQKMEGSVDQYEIITKKRQEKRDKFLKDLEQIAGDITQIQLTIEE